MEEYITIIIIYIPPWQGGMLVVYNEAVQTGRLRSRRHLALFLEMNHIIPPCLSLTFTRTCVRSHFMSLKLLVAGHLDFDRGV